MDKSHEKMFKFKMTEKQERKVGGRKDRGRDKFSKKITIKKH